MNHTHEEDEQARAAYGERPHDELRKDDENIRKGARNEDILDKMKANADQQPAPSSGTPEGEREDPGYGVGDSSDIDNGER